MVPVIICGVIIVILVFVLILKIKAANVAEDKVKALMNVLEASHKLGASTSLENVMPLVSDSVKKFFKVDSMAVYLLDEENVEEPMMRAKGVVSPHSEVFKDFNSETVNTYLGKVLRERKSVIFRNFNEEATDESFLPKDKDFHGVMIAPLMVEGRAVGAMFISTKQVGGYDQEMLVHYDMLAGQVALAIRNVQLQEGLSAMAIRDSLSGLYTHGYFQEHLGKCIVKAKYANQAVSLMILDMDFFKKVNDNYGHPQGDALLKQLGGVIKSVVRPTDTICRYGGDEFAVTMVDTNRIQAVVVAEQIRQSVEEYEFVLGAQIVHITISGGVAAFPEDSGTKKELIQKADDAMYQAKKQGRNKICFAA